MQGFSLMLTMSAEPQQQKDQAVLANYGNVSRSKYTLSVQSAAWPRPALEACLQDAASRQPRRRRSSRRPLRYRLRMQIAACPRRERHAETADAAGSRHTAPDSPVPAYARNFIGRYHANIPCEDDFVACEKGTAEFILNLLPDGTVHRSIIHYGKIFADRNATAGSDGAVPRRHPDGEPGTDRINRAPARKG